MKYILFWSALLSILGCLSLRKSQSKTDHQLSENQKKEMARDSLIKSSVSHDSLNKLRDENVKKPAKSKGFMIEKVVLPTGGVFIFETSNNARTKEVLQSLFPNKSPIEMLVELRNIEGYISFWNNTFPKDWLKREHISQLLEMSNIPIITPQFILVRDGFSQTDEELAIQNARKLKDANYGRQYVLTSIGWNALALISGYINNGHFTGRPLASTEKIKEWYASGKPREEFKFR